MSPVNSAKASKKSRVALSQERGGGDAVARDTLPPEEEAATAVVRRKEEKDTTYDMNNPDPRKGSKRRREQNKSRRRLLIHGGWPSKRLGLQICKGSFIHTKLLVKTRCGIWSERHQGAVKLTRLGYWKTYEYDVEKVKALQDALIREEGMEQWEEYGDGDREEVRLLIGKVKEEYWRRMPEQQRKKVIADLAEKRRLEEEKTKERAIAVAAACEKKRPGPAAQPRRPQQAMVSRIASRRKD
uniref:Uncharacterized protein n=1 Tax=Leersia perrieri TaxID=77586 RepID=A0A0D9UYX1_9ORYZ